MPDLLHNVPVFVLVFTRVAGMMLAAPLFGNSKIPRRVKLLLSLVLALGLSAGVPWPVLPQSTWELAVGMGGEIVFGMVMGMAMNFTFVGVSWAGEIIGQQMGINLGETFDPSFGQSATLVGDLYFMLTLVIFLVVGGHHAMLQGVRESFDVLPLLSVGVNKGLLDMFLTLLTVATTLAMQLAAPMLLTMLVVDLVLGFVGKTMPQFNVMSAGMSMKSALGVLILLVGLSLASQTIQKSVLNSMQSVRAAWNGIH